MTSVSKETEKFEEYLEQKEGTWLRELRQEALDYFKEIGYPTPKEEDWKYTNVAPFVSSNVGELPRVLVYECQEQIDENLLRQFDYKRNGFTALHLGLANFKVVRIPKETKIEEPIRFEFHTDRKYANFPHIIVIAEAGSKATIIESYKSDSGDRIFTNTAIQIFVEDNANLTHYRVQKEGTDAFHVGTTEVTLGRGSLYKATNINLGAKLSRHDVHLKFTEEGAEAYVDGLYMLGSEQHHDTHSEIDHRLPNCVSHQTYKGVLNDKSRGVFNGKVFVRENASGTDAQQSNKNLLLSNDARVDTKPQLEIFNDDVKCSHGATVGQLEDEELFYLLSRGISENLAKNLLTYGFAEEIINKIEIEAIKNELDAMVLNRLDVNLEV
jgi:Fe-S cluster assembly protein SufD